MKAYLIILTVLGLPVFFLLRRILKARISNEKKKNAVSLVTTLIIVPVICITLIISYFGYLNYYPKINFDNSAWESNEEERFKMSGDIIESEMLIGKTKEEVVGILGSDFSTYNDNHIAYYLGFVPRMFNIDPDVLDIHFENNKVIKVAQHET